MAEICGDGGGGDEGRIWVLGFDFGWGSKGWVLGLGEGDVSVWVENRDIYVFWF